ncbi:T-box protein 2-like [Temnothorax curvispinosus]|uniref:T-box protein 2-like n=1 Tax=Temnothorax curvispinosus TaxID=300111 RepID=A0A6J1R341_9HYME|nr:T-box protein 2-like [Temnothorax curvispinosus]
MFLQDPNNALMSLELQNMQLASPIFAQSPIALQRKLGERMNSSEWVFQPPLLRGVNVELLNRNLWQQFYENSTEMIITKSGRRMFPSVQINVSGLEKRENYYVLMEIAPASDRRHKYCGYQNGGKNSNMGGWSFAGPAEPQQPFSYRIYKHPDSPATGSHWMDNPISFNKLKLTNNINDPNNNVVLTSMHKYVPRIWIVRCFDAKNYNELFTHPTATFAFKETEFIAVTAYQNENITKLKINNNPFAKGFRETGQSRFKRKHHSIDHQAQSDSSPDEGVSLTYDSESNQVASEGDSVASIAENSMESMERLMVEENTDNNDARDDARPIAANPRSPEKAENELEVPFHRPWTDPPRSRHQVMPSSYYNLHYPHHPSYYPPYYLYSQYVASDYMRLRDYQFNYFYRHLGYGYPRL